MTCPSTCSSPTAQASNISFSSVGQNSMTINWTNGNGSNRIVVMSQEYPVSGTPVAGTTYTPNTVFGSGSEMSPDEFVVYNNSGSSVSVSGLTSGQTYYVSIFEYNCLPGSEIYLAPAVSSSQITYSITTGATPENHYCVSSSTGFAATIAFTSTGIFTGNTYTAQLSDATGSFASSVNIGTLVSNLNSGVINCNIPANTPSGTGYLIRVISNGPSVIGSSSSPFEVELFTPSIAPTSVNSSRNNLCEDYGGTIELSATGGSGTTLVWYASSCGGTSIGTGTPLTIAAPASTATYFARWEKSCSSSDCKSVTVIVKPKVLASVTVETSANPVCEGSSVTFTANPTNGGTTPSYQWQLNGANILGQTNSSYITSTLVNGDQVKCIMTSNEACATGSPATSNTITMSVNTALPVSVSIAASANPVCEGSSVTFTANPTNGGTTPSYQWQLNGANILGQTNRSYITSTLINGDQVKCIMTSNEACASGSPATSNTITMSVNTALPVSVSIAASANPVCEGSSVTFTANPTNGGTIPSYQWQLNGANILGQTNSSYITSTLVNGDQVKCVLNSSETCKLNNPATSNTISLNVSPLPVSAGVISGIKTVCQGQNSLTYSIPGISNATSYTWTLPAGATGSSTTNEIIVNYGLSAVSGNIKVKGTNTCGNGSESTLAITVNEKPMTPVITQNTSSSVVLNSTAPIGNQWYNSNVILNGATDRTYSVEASGHYYVIVTINGCSSDPSNILDIDFSTNINLSTNSIKIYPNPVSDLLVIEMATNSTKTGFEVYNSKGQSICKGELLDKTKIQTSSFSKGIYLIKFERNNSLTFMKFIKE